MCKQKVGLQKTLFPACITGHMRIQQDQGMIGELYCKTKEIYNGLFLRECKQIWLGW